MSKISKPPQISSFKTEFTVTHGFPFLIKIWNATIWNFAPKSSARVVRAGVESKSKFTCQQKKSWKHRVSVPQNLLKNPDPKEIFKVTLSPQLQLSNSLLVDACALILLPILKVTSFIQSWNDWLWHLAWYGGTWRRNRRPRRRRRKCRHDPSVMRRPAIRTQIQQERLPFARRLWGRYRSRFFLQVGQVWKF